MADKLRSSVEAESIRPVLPLATAQPEPAAGSAASPKHADRRAYQKAIGQGLRKYFNAVVSEPIPEEFLDLLNKMDQDDKDGSK